MKHYLAVLTILLLPLLAVLGHAFMDEPLAEGLSRVSRSSIESFFATEADTTAADTIVADTVAVDTVPQRILFFGDSMVEGLGRRMAQYAEANGHKLTYVVWYSSTTYVWCRDTLRHFIDEVDPTFVMVTIGGNEQATRNTEVTEKNIRKIIETIGDRPYIWICTPEWDKDAPFNFIPERICGKKRFFDSRKLTYERMKDNRHPTFEASAKWMDSVAVWMQSQETAYPIVMKVPADSLKGKCVKHSIKPSEIKRNSYGREEEADKDRHHHHHH